MLCAIYCRLSKEDEEAYGESESIVNQKALLSSHAREKGWEIYKLYCDEDYSGVDRSRPQFNALLADAQAGCFQLVLCKSQSRFTRDMELVEKYIHHDFLLWGIRFVTLTDNADTEVKGNKKARQINGLVNEWYLEDLSENIRTVLDYKRKQGEFIGSFAAYGYMKDEQDRNKLVIDVVAAKVVQRIFSLYLRGFGLQKIATLLNEEGTANPTTYKQSLGLAYVNRGGEAGLWNKTTVGRILKNPLYIGVMTQGKRRKLSYKDKNCAEIPREEWVQVANTHEPIIEKKIFFEVQRLIQLRGRAQANGTVHALASKVFCADCGSILSKVTGGGNGKKTAYLRCRRHAANKSTCSGHYIPLVELMQAVEAKVQEYWQQCSIIAETACFAAMPQNQSIARTKALCTAQLEKRMKALKSLYLDRAAGQICEETFLALSESLLKEKKTYAERLAFLEKEEQNAKAEEESMQKNKQAHAHALSGFQQLDRELAGLLIDKITVWESDKKSGEQKICIDWLF